MFLKEVYFHYRSSRITDNGGCRLENLGSEGVINGVAGEIFVGCEGSARVLRVV